MKATYKNPYPDEIGLILEVVWIDRERAMVVELVGLPINPTRVVLTDDILVTE